MNHLAGTLAEGGQAAEAEQLYHERAYGDKKSPLPGTCRCAMEYGQLYTDA